MQDENLDSLLDVLANALDTNVFYEDIEKIQFLCHSLKKLYSECLSLSEVDDIKKDINYLEIKYDQFNELSYYFDPLYIKIKNMIHDENVKKIREENKRKKEVI